MQGFDSLRDSLGLVKKTEMQRPRVTMFLFPHSVFDSDFRGKKPIFGPQARTMLFYFGGKKTVVPGTKNGVAEELFSHT